MVDIDQFLSNIDIMRYLLYTSPPTPLQILRPVLNGVAHDLVLTHSHTIDSFFPAHVSGKPRAEHRHPQSHILLYTSGGATGMYCGKKYDAQRGLMLLISPNEPHLFDPPLESGCLKMFEISFLFTAGKDPALAPFHIWLSALSGTDVPQLTFPMVLEESQTRHLIGLHEKLMSRWEQRGPLAWFGVNAVMLDIFAFLLEDIYSIAGKDYLQPLESRMMQARDCIDHRYNETLNLKDMADETGVSLGYFCRCFKKTFGITPIAYQNNRRMITAQTLLRATDMTMKEIADQLGYVDIYSFSKAFKRITGTSPGKYRNQKSATIKP